MLSTSLHLTFNPSKSAIFILLSTLILLLLMFLLDTFPDVKDITNSFGLFLFVQGRVLIGFFKKLQVNCKRRGRKKVKSKLLKVWCNGDHSISK